MKKLLLIIMSLLFSAVAFAHSGHTPFEFSGAIEVVKHHLSNPYHIAVIFAMSITFIASAVIVTKRRQVFSAVLMALGFASSMLGIGLLLS